MIIVKCLAAPLCSKPNRYFIGNIPNKKCSKYNYLHWINARRVSVLSVLRQKYFKIINFLDSQKAYSEIQNLSFFDKIFYIHLIFSNEDYQIHITQLSCCKYMIHITSVQWIIAWTIYHFGEVHFSSWYLNWFVILSIKGKD